jgi:hypothetical protein
MYRKDDSQQSRTDHCQPVLLAPARCNFRDSDAYELRRMKIMGGWFQSQDEKKDTL